MCYAKTLFINRGHNNDYLLIKDKYMEKKIPSHQIQQPHGFGKKVSKHAKH